MICLSNTYLSIVLIVLRYRQVVIVKEQKKSQPTNHKEKRYLQRSVAQAWREGEREGEKDGQEVIDDDETNKLEHTV